MHLASRSTARADCRYRQSAQRSASAAIRPGSRMRRLRWSLSARFPGSCDRAMSLWRRRKTCTSPEQGLPARGSPCNGETEWIAETEIATGIWCCNGAGTHPMRQRFCDRYDDRRGTRAVDGRQYRASGIERSAGAQPLEQPERGTPDTRNAKHDHDGLRPSRSDSSPKDHR